MGLRPTPGNENQGRRAHVGARHGVPLQWPARVIFRRAKRGTTADFGAASEVLVRINGLRRRLAERGCAGIVFGSLRFSCGGISDKPG